MAKVKTGLTADSVKNMVFGAGVLFKNFSTTGTHYKKTFDKTPLSGKEYYYMSGGSSGGVSYTLFDGTAFTSGTTYFEKYEGYGGDKIGATQGGAKASITPEYTDIDVDGVLVKMEGLTRKTGEKGTIEATVIDMSPQNMAMAVNGTVSYTGTTTSTENSIMTNSDISSGDYITNLALVAPLTGTNDLIAVIFSKALCTSGFEINTQNKNVSGNKFTFEAYAEQSDVNVDTLPVEIIVLKKG